VQLMLVKICNVHRGNIPNVITVLTLVVFVWLIINQIFADQFPNLPMMMLYVDMLMNQIVVVRQLDGDGMWKMKLLTIVNWQLFMQLKDGKKWFVLMILEMEDKSC